jgi:hypothetical protein
MRLFEATPVSGATDDQMRMLADVAPGVIGGQLSIADIATAYRNPNYLNRYGWSTTAVTPLISAPKWSDGQPVAIGADAVVIGPGGVFTTTLSDTFNEKAAAKISWPQEFFDYATPDGAAVVSNTEVTVGKTIDFRLTNTVDAKKYGAELGKAEAVVAIDEETAQPDAANFSLVDVYGVPANEVNDAPALMKALVSYKQPQTMFMVPGAGVAGLQNPWIAQFRIPSNPRFAYTTEVNVGGSVGYISRIPANALVVTNTQVNVGEVAKGVSVADVLQGVDVDAVLAALRYVPASVEDPVSGGVDQVGTAMSN